MYTKTETVGEFSYDSQSSNLKKKIRSAVLELSRVLVPLSNLTVCKISTTYFPHSFYFQPKRFESSAPALRHSGNVSDGRQTNILYSSLSSSNISHKYQDSILLQSIPFHSTYIIHSHAATFLHKPKISYSVIKNE